MEEGQISGAPKGKEGKNRMVIAIGVAVIVIVVLSVVALAFMNGGGAKDRNALITAPNSEVVIGLSDLPSGWDVTIAYRLDPYATAPQSSEVGVARYTHNISLDPLTVEVITLELYHMNTTEAAKDLFAQYMAEGVHSYQSIELQVVGNVSVGDEAVLCSGNWTGSHGAIKTLVFRENNIIVLLVYEATENVNLSNETAIDMARLQDEKLLR